jgi:hypothetical protein
VVGNQCSGELSTFNVFIYNLKMEAMRPSETLFTAYKIMRRQNEETHYSNADCRDQLRRHYTHPEIVMA